MAKIGDPEGSSESTANRWNRWIGGASQAREIEPPGPDGSASYSCLFSCTRVCLAMCPVMPTGTCTAPPLLQVYPINLTLEVAYAVLSAMQEFWNS